MEHRTIYITEKDKQRLEELILVAKAFSCDRQGELTELSNDLARARIVPSKAIPGNVVTMNSNVELSFTPLGCRSNYALVFPKDASDKKKLSVLAPLGMAIFGHFEGAVVLCNLSSVCLKIKIEKIHNSLKF